jgi:DNA-binding NarL/FixJ family response regulator
MSVVLADPVSDTAPMVLVVNDHELIGQGLQTLLQLNGFRSVLSSPASVATDAVSADPNVVLLDIDLADRARAEELIPRLGELGCTVLLLAAATDRVTVARWLEAGAVGVVSKTASVDELLDRVRDAAEGTPVICANEWAQLLVELDEYRREQQCVLAPFAHLSPKESGVLHLMLDGLSAEEIAHSSWVSLATVRTQIRSILRKLHVNSQREATTLARQCGWTGGAQ